MPSFLNNTCNAARFRVPLILAALLLHACPASVMAHLRSSSSLNNSTMTHHRHRACGSHSRTPEQKEAVNAAVRKWRMRRDSGAVSTRSTYNIPVYFVAFQPSSSVAYVRDQDFTDMVSRLNSGYTNTPFRFSLAGFKRVVDADAFVGRNYENFNAKHKFGGDSDLTVYLFDTDEIHNAMGWAYLPPADASYDAVYNYSPAIKDQGWDNYMEAQETLVHE